MLNIVITHLFFLNIKLTSVPMQLLTELAPIISERNADNYIPPRSHFSHSHGGASLEHLIVPKQQDRGLRNVFNYILQSLTIIKCSINVISTPR